MWKCPKCGREFKKEEQDQLTLIEKEQDQKERVNKAIQKGISI